ncbi:MAG: penicillin-binding protein [Chitinophagia bacterium]|nr:penicillin-binding protein [Chitinophagia bacterium]
MAANYSTAYSTGKGGRPRTKGSIKLLWGGFLAFIVLFCLLVVAIDNGLVGDMPSLPELENPQSAISSEVYASDGKTILGRYFYQDRSYCNYDSLGSNIINALIATEDARFQDHSGIDPIGTVAIPFYILLNKKRGSSTLTQQLAKNLFPREHESLLTIPFIKLKEWVLAVKLERNLTKEEIITLYLSHVPFGGNLYGVKNAALTFFNKQPNKLSIDEAAILVGMLKANTKYNPLLHHDRAIERRNTVLEQMEKYGYLDANTAGNLKRQDTKLNYHKIDYHDGIAPYFRQVLEQEVKKVLRDQKKPDGTPYNLYSDGLKIYTTIDVRMQAYADSAVEEHMRELQKQFMAQPAYHDGTVWAKSNTNAQNILNNSIKASDRYKGCLDQGMTEEEAMATMRKPVSTRVFAWNKERSKDTVISPIDSIKYMKTFLQAGFMAMDPFTGEVKAWVGGIDHNFFQYDHVNINTKRQVGSTIKPLLYSLAIDVGNQPCDIISTDPQLFPGMDKPYDAGGSENGNVSMKYALAHSLNNAALNILNTRIKNIPAFVEFAHKCGITSHLVTMPSVALGVSDISLFEMMGAYTMFPNKGKHTDPYFLMKIADKNNVIIKNFAPTQKDIISPESAYKMVGMMKGVVDMGTGARLRYRYGIRSEVAGKTGTTNNQADAWFLGYTPQLLAGAWVGCDDREFRFRSESLGQGAAAALPIWAFFMRRVYADKSLNINPGAHFKMPDGYTDCDGNLVPPPDSTAARSDDEHAAKLN